MRLQGNVKLLPLLPCITIMLPFSTWVCVRRALSPPDAINKTLEGSRVELRGYQAPGGEVRVAQENLMSFAAMVPVC